MISSLVERTYFVGKTRTSDDTPTLRGKEAPWSSYLSLERDAGKGRQGQ